ncbi:MAG: AAA family ATPase [Chloroflexota bacterium]
MKIAISGKGGVGKTLIAALMGQLLTESGYSVIAIDADPDANLGASLGFAGVGDIVPVSEMKELIAERTGVKEDETPTFYKLNPQVADIPDKYALKQNGIALMVMGRVKKGGTGCYCPENAFLQALTTHLLLLPNEVVIMDMAAGIEHLSRGTARMVDRLIIIVEPTRQSVATAERIMTLARDLGIKGIALIGNKIRGDRDKEFLSSSLSGMEFLGFVPYDEKIAAAEQTGTPLLTASPEVTGEVRRITHTLLPESSKN